MLSAIADDDVADRALGDIVIAGARLPELPPGSSRFDDDVAERIGPYRVLEEIGRGGLATVYLAARDDDFSRRVALKLIRRGMDTEDLLERLRLERQILANLDHPNIARLYDGGTAPDGRPYFVMEVIFGERIDAWCASRALPLDERLRLFRKVCAAVHFAHQNLVLHRDLKPSNILVTETGEPKLLDFGIAKVLEPGSVRDARDQPLAALATLTGPGERLLTPEFASPEQVRGESLTTASDVYSLGVLLFLLLTGERPYSFDRRRPAEIERVVCETPPPRPSALVRAHPEAGTGWHPPASGDDLDTIVQMALHKDPARRYASAADLADDLRRYQARQVVRARPDTLGYRAKKFVRRNWLPVSATLLLFLVLSAAVVITTQQAAIARAERQKTEEQRWRAEEISEFLMRLFEVSDPFVEPAVGEGDPEVDARRPRGETITARQLLDEGAREIRSSLEGSPVARADLLYVIGVAYRNLSLFEDSKELLFETFVLRDRYLGDDHPDTIETQRELAVVSLELGEHEHAGVLLRAALLKSTEQFGPDHLEVAETLFWLGQWESRQGNYGAAQAHFRRCLAIRRQHLPETSLEAAAARRGLGEALFSQGEFRDAARIFEQVLDVQREHHGESHPEIATVLNNLALCHLQMGEPTEAVPLLERAVEMRRHWLGEHHGHVAQALYNLAHAHRRVGDLASAEQRAREALEIQREVFGTSHESLAQSLLLLGLVAEVDGRYGEADERLREALAVRRELLGDRALPVAQVYFRLAQVAERAGDPARAETRYWRCLEIQRATDETVPVRQRLWTLHKLAERLLDRGATEEAETLAREAVELHEPSTDPDTRAESEALLGRALAAQER